MKRILLLLFTLVTMAGYAQYPITSISINLPANPPANTADWAAAMPPVMITAQSQLRNGKVPPEVIESKILVTIKQGGSKKYGIYTNTTAPQSGFTSAVKNWSGANAVSLLGKDETLPPGTYEFCVQFFGINAPVQPLSNEVCKTFTIAEVRNDTKPIANISITMSPTPPANTADWATSIPPVMITAQTKLINGQVPGNVMESKILVTIKQAGSKKYGIYTPGNAPASGFTSPVKNWSGANAVSLLGKDETLPPGTYEFCVQFFSINTPVQPLSNEVCKSFTIAEVRNDTKPITNISITMSPTPPANTADWATSIPPVMITAQTKLINGQVPGNVQESKILVTIKQGGSKKYGAYTAGTAPASGFTSPVKNWSGANATSLLGKDVTLEPGSYELCVQLFSQGPAGMIAISDEKCKPFTIKDTKDQNYTPPVNITPADKKIFTEDEIKAPITFRWTPLLPRPRDPVIYKLRVWQIKEGQKGPQAMKGNSPVVEKEVKELTQFVKQNLMGDIEMVGGSANLIWNVQAVNEKGKVMGESEATTFNLGSPCSPDYEMIMDTIACGSDGKVHITGHVAILPKPGLTINQVKLTNFNVTNYLGATVNTSLSLPFILTASGNNYPFNFIVNDSLCNKILHIGYLISSTCAGTGNTNITDCFKDTIMPCCTIPPDCCKNGKWKEKFIVENGVKKDLPCGSSFAATFQCNTTKTFLVSYSCNPNCATPAQIEYGIYNGSSGAQVGTSTIVSSGTLATITMPSTAGYYCLKIYAKCGGKICDSCIVCFKVACVEDCCKGSKWGDQYIEGVQKVICGTNIPTMACNATRKVVFNYICNPNLPIPCKASIDYIIKDYASGVIVSSISNIASGTSTIITAPATPGYYCLTIYAKCNGSICDSCKVCFKVDCQPDCCKGGSWGEKLRINDNGTSTKLDSCGSDLGIAQCGYSGKLNVTYNCNPACSTKAQIVYQYYDATTNLPVGASVIVASGTNATITNPTTSGSYYLSIAAKCGDKICEECRLYFKLVCKPDCCKGSKWGDKLIIENNGAKKDLPCGNTMATVKCKEKKSFQVFYYCGTPNCKATIEYVITKGNTNVFVSSTGDVASGFSQTITMPSLPDYYCLKIYAKCDGKICDSCVVCFKVDCIPDCCKGSKWGEKFVVDNNGVKKDLPACGSDTGTVKCNETKTLQVFYYCNPNCQTTAQVVYQFYTLSGTPVGSAVQVNSGDLANIITPSIQGSYCLRIYGKCAGTICDSCVICFKVECIPDCCKDGKWGEKFIVENNGAKKDLPPCGKDIATVLCKSTKTFQVYYYCNPKCNTTAEIEYQVYDGSNQPVGASVVVSSGALANITMPSIAGNYCIKISAKCGGKICAECKFCFKVECIDCCKDSKWGTISWKGFNTVKCGTTLTVVLPVQSVQTVNFTFNCYGGCTSSINYVVKTTSGTVISSVNSAASGVDKDITMPSGAGDYCLWAYGICNGIICDSCKVCFSTTCIDCKKVAIKDDTQQTTGNAFFNINGTIMTMFPISKITAQLVSFSADNDPSTSNNAPVPNFEFSIQPGGISTINSSTVSLPYSLTTTRSNIAISGGPLPPNVPFNLFIDNYQDKKVKHYRVKFTIFFVNGTYCEKEIQKTF